ncbi:N-acetyltransferase [Pseudomonas helleri]|uniref:N-acetyltransferase n=1 Tax=Pseudomonas helleri TaxID=1608996 RepID=A0A6I1WJI4_9PSED|nr:N-acetyltransferase [Pseudomonas helleri]MQT74213.1 N-acetyltransferase [Pseudomonas helleri]MQU42080.1 N-acetyltransferase [Pseudomonas helleri]
MIRRFEPRDMDRLLEIWLSASIKAHDFIDASFWQSNTESMRDVYIPASETFVIEDSSGVLGFYSLLDNQLAALFVDPAHQGNGFGKQLLDHAKCLRNELSLAVYKENTPSVGFYTSQGFKRVKEQIDEKTGLAEFLMCYPG